MLRLFVVWQSHWNTVKTRLRDDSGTVSNETAWVTGLLIAGAAIIVAAIIAWGIDQANSISTDVAPVEP